MLRKDIQAFIKAIREHQNIVVKRMLSDLPDLVSAKAKSPPKKNDGQSPLQIAFKAGNFEAAATLLEYGADPNFIEDSEINEWKAPVLHDAIRATIFNCKTLRKDTRDFERGLHILRAMLEMGADPNSEDSYGNTCGMRAVLDARQMIFHPDADNSEAGTVSQLRRVFDVLYKYGADYSHSTQTRASTMEAIKDMGLAEYKLLPDKA